jgi:ATP-dependent Lon protease
MVAFFINCLDHSFTDNYLDVSVDLTQTIFIATANDWANVPAVIRDRFVEIKVDGYTRYEKEKIISDYIIPKVEESYAASGVSISMDDKAMEYLLKTYASRLSSET